MCCDSSVQRNSFAVRISDRDSLRPRRERGNGKRVDVFERNRCGFSVDGYTDAVNETAAANGKDCASGRRNRGRLQQDPSAPYTGTERQTG